MRWFGCEKSNGRVGVGLNISIVPKSYEYNCTRLTELLDGFVLSDSYYFGIFFVNMV